MCTLWQRFGRGARGLGLKAIALFLVEPMYFDETKEQKAERKAKKDEKEKKRKELSTKGKQKQDELDDSPQVHKKRRIDPPGLLIASRDIACHNSHTPDQVTATLDHLTPTNTLARLRSSLITHSFPISMPSAIPSMIVTSHITRQLSHGQEVEQREALELEELDSESEVELDQADDAADLYDERCAGVQEKGWERAGAGHG
jgi:hypothetical protein